MPPCSKKTALSRSPLIKHAELSTSKTTSWIRTDTLGGDAGGSTASTRSAVSGLTTPASALRAARFHSLL